MRGDDYMKLVMIVSGEEYTACVTSLLDQKGFCVTEIGSSGDFLEYGKTVYLLGVPDQDVERVLDVLRNDNELNKTSEFKFHDEVSVYVMEMSGFQRVNP